MKYFLVAFLLIQLLSCSKKAEPLAQAVTNPTSALSVLPRPNKEVEEKSADDFVTKEERQNYDGYDIFKQRKSVIENETKIEVTTVLLKKNSKIVATYSGKVHPYTTTDFGLFPFLGNDLKQLIVSTTEPRGGEQWIAELSPTYRKIFNTKEWRVGREGADLKFVDINNDGVYEIIALDVWFLIFDNLSMSESPMVSVIFKYNPTAKKFVPANHLFSSYALKGIQEEVEKFSTVNKDQYLGSKVYLLLKFLYAGKEKEGWEFFESSYQAKDKTKVKNTIKNILKNSRTYQYIRAHSDSEASPVGIRRH